MSIRQKAVLTHDDKKWSSKRLTVEGIENEIVRVTAAIIQTFYV